MISPFVTKELMQEFQAWRELEKEKRKKRVPKKASMMQNAGLMISNEATSQREDATEGVIDRSDETLEENVPTPTDVGMDASSDVQESRETRKRGARNATEQEPVHEPKILTKKQRKTYEGMESELDELKALAEKIPDAEIADMILRARRLVSVTLLLPD